MFDALEEFTETVAFCGGRETRLVHGSSFRIVRAVAAPDLQPTLPPRPYDEGSRNLDIAADVPEHVQTTSPIIYASCR
jgi:hypothetical protein